MPQSLSRVLMHMVFSTKDRVPVLPPEIRRELPPYLAAVLCDHNNPSLRVGGTSDHVHLLFGLSRSFTIAQVAEKVKTASNKWLKTKNPILRDFQWQAGYGAFSVSPHEAEAVVQYIKDQEEHHRKKTYKEEFLDFLKEYRVEYDERYVWD